MQLVRTSLNLRSNVPWSILYKECIYAWLDGSKIHPYSKWSYKIENKLLPRYNKTGRNDKCPCDSGKKV